MHNLTHFALDSQCGGMAGKSTDMASHVVRLYMQIMEWLGHSAATFFADVASAVYSAIREMILPMHAADQEIAALFKALGLTPDAMHELYKQLEHGSVLDQAGVDHHLALTMAECQMDTFLGV